MAQKKIIVRHSWTKDEIKMIINLWETENTETLAEKLGLTVNQIVYMAGLIRKEGYKLTKKRKNGVIRLLVLEAIKEIR